MSELWIVHRDRLARSALATLVGAAARAAHLGEPADAAFAGEGGAPVIVLGVSGDGESELAFALVQRLRSPDARWVIIGDAGWSRARLERVFAGLGALVVTHPPRPEILRSAVARARAAAEGPLPLSVRRLRAMLGARCERYFRDLELRELQRAPDIRGVRLLVRGEPGTGRLLLVRCVRALGPEPEDPFVAVPCDASTALDELLRAVRDHAGAGDGVALCLVDVDRLAPAVQRALSSWLQSGEPLPEALGLRRIRWAATASDEEDALLPELADALGEVCVRLPPLRERAEAIPSFAAATTAAWASERGQPAPGFSDSALAALSHHPWPGNLVQLEATVRRTLAASPSDPVAATELRFDGVGEGWAEEPIGPAATVKGIETHPGYPGRPQAEGAEAVAAEARPGPAARPAEDEEIAARLLSALAGGLSHAVRNPLVAIRTFASLLPERFEDPEFRARFHEQVGEEVERINEVVERLARFAALGEPRVEPVDVTGLVERLLEMRRPEIQERRLLVLQELDPTRPLALADASMLHFALDGLLSRALAWIPDRADLFVASKHHPLGRRDGGVVRVLLRFYDPGAKSSAEWGAGADVSLQRAALEFVLADVLIRGQGGTMRIESTESDETSILLELPAAP